MPPGAPPATWKTPVPSSPRALAIWTRRACASSGRSTSPRPARRLVFRAFRPQRAADPVLRLVHRALRRVQREALGRRAVARRGEDSASLIRQHVKLLFQKFWLTLRWGARGTRILIPNGARLSSGTSDDLGTTLYDYFRGQASDSITRGRYVSISTCLQPPLEVGFNIHSFGDKRDTVTDGEIEDWVRTGGLDAFFTFGWSDTSATLILLYSRRSKSG